MGLSSELTVLVEEKFLTNQYCRELVEKVRMTKMKCRSKLTVLRKI